MPPATASCGPRCEIMPTMWCSLVPKWKLRSRPLVKPVVLPCHCANRRSSGISRPVNTPRLRCRGRMYSSGVQGQRAAHRNGLLPDARKPLAHFALPEQNQHFLLNQAGLEQVAVEVEQGFVGVVLAVEVHSGKTGSGWVGPKVRVWVGSEIIGRTLWNPPAGSIYLRGRIPCLILSYDSIPTLRIPLLAPAGRPGPTAGYAQPAPRGDADEG